LEGRELAFIELPSPNLKIHQTSRKERKKERKRERERMVAESIHLLHRSAGYTTTLEQTTDSGSLG
jgi:hypothetical protein